MLCHGPSYAVHKWIFYPKYLILTIVSLLSIQSPIKIHQAIGWYQHPPLRNICHSIPWVCDSFDGACEPFLSCSCRSKMTNQYSQLDGRSHLCLHLELFQVMIQKLYLEHPKQAKPRLRTWSNHIYDTYNTSKTSKAKTKNIKQP